MRVVQSIDEPIRTGLCYDEKWRGDDRGLIACREAGLAPGFTFTKIR